MCNGSWRVCRALGSILARASLLMKVWPHPTDRIEPEWRVRAEFSFLVALHLLAVGLLLLSASPLFAQSEDNPFSKWAPPWDASDPPAHAWRSDAGYVWVFQKDIERTGAEVTAWVNETSFQPMEKNVVRILSRITFDCVGRMRYTAQSTYDPKGIIVEEIDADGAWKFIRPQSKFETVEIALCSQKSA